MNLNFLHSASWFEYSESQPWFFTEYSFLAVFGLVAIVYAFLKPSSRSSLIFISLFSLFFYYKSSGWFLALFMGMIAVDFIMARLISTLKGSLKTLVFYLAILISLSPLLYFKYAGLFIETCNQLCGTQFNSRSLFLPIGISFYTFQSLSYLIDVYRTVIPASTSFLHYVFYMTFFPHLVAGPIVRAKDFLPQIPHTVFPDRHQCNEALLKISQGLFKKLILADYLGQWVDMVYAQPLAFTGFETTTSVYAYAFQIYFDFSGYSDIAIGLALLLGFRLKENFNTPYLASSISDFWRRWHMSLSSWLRDYIYIPLGGNQKGAKNTYLFLIITMLVGGLWHGASWKFVLWGLAHGIALALHKLLFKKSTNPVNSIGLQIIYTLFTFHLVCLLWILFRAPTALQALEIAQHSVAGDWSFNIFTEFVLTRTTLSLIFCLAVAWIVAPALLNKQIKQKLNSFPIGISMIVFLLILIVSHYVRLDVIQPFIYFQF